MRINTEYHASRASSRYPTQRPRGSGCGCGAPVDKSMMTLAKMQGEDSIDNLRSQSHLNFTVINVHTYHGEAQIAMKKLLSLLTVGLVHILGDPVPE